MGFTIEQLNPHSCRSYLIGVEGKNEVMLIDPILEHQRSYLDLLEKRGCRLTHVVDTHTHADHISGAAALKDATDCDYIMHANAPAMCANFRVADGFEWDYAGELPVKVLYTPGHTQDSISLVLPNALFTGDCLFLDDGGAGRDDLPGGDAGAHWESLQRLSRLPEDLIVYPAHDYRDRRPSSLQQQKKTNPHLEPRGKEDFIHYLDDLRLGPADWMKDVLNANYACARDPKAAWIPVDAPACEIKGTLDEGVNEIQVSSITAPILKQKMGAASSPVLVDVREPYELEAELGHIEGVLNIPIGELSARIDELENSREREIVMVCRSGARAHAGTQILTKAGFPSVSLLCGGMLAWLKL